MNFSHCDHSENHLTLHDCIAERAYFENGKLGFEFHDGFWVSPNHPESNLSELVRTDFSKVEFLTYDEGLCVQCMHIGPYDNEPATVELMHQFMSEQGRSGRIAHNMV